MSFDVRHQHVVVAGGGRSGVAAADLLLTRGARVTLSDLREPEGAAALRDRGVTLDVGPHRAEMFAAANLIVLSPGVPPDQPGDCGPRDACGQNRIISQSGCHVS